MKTIFRIIVILAAATIVGSLLYAGVMSAGTTSGFNGFDGDGDRPQFEAGREVRPDGFGENLNPEGERRGHDESGGFPGGILKAIVLMSVAGGIYSLFVSGGRTAKKILAS